MFRAVMFDMGGTLEDIWVDEETSRAAVAALDRMLKGWGMDPGLSPEALRERVDAGWKRYEGFRSREDVELKPIELWRDYILADFGFPADRLAPHSEEIAHMWEVTHYHRELRPGVPGMLSRLRDAGLRLGIISNTAALYQVFDSLTEYGIRDFFRDVTLSSVTGLRKPRPEIFDVSLRQLQVRPEESVYVGDTVSRDIIGSKRAGFGLAIQIGSHLTKEKDRHLTDALQPDAFIEDIRDVADIVLRANGA